jgi:transposase
VAATKDAAVFHLDRGRHRGALRKLLGEQIEGLLCTDRYGPYEQHPPARRQLCWSHLKRDFRAQEERAGAAGRWGRRALKLTHQLFELWHRFKQGGIVRSTLQRKTRPVKKRLHRLLIQGKQSGIEQLSGLCANLLRLEKALWTFLRIEGLEPTNNHAERMLRPAVQWRKKSLGCHSEQGCRFVERMLSVIQTCRLRARSVMDHLQRALRSYRQELAQLSAPAIQLPLKTAA